MVAHIRILPNGELEEQTVVRHSRNVALICRNAMSLLGMRSLGYLAGLLHDAGKETTRFERYLRSQFGSKPPSAARGEIAHSPIGAIFIYERWYSGDLLPSTTAQLLAMAIYGHHSGLMDAMSLDGSSPLLQKLSRDKTELCYDEAVKNFLSEVCTLDELDRLFAAAVAELSTLRKRLGQTLDSFSIGLLLRTLFSALVDADRWDSACFAYGEDPFTPVPAPDWHAASAALEQTLGAFPSDTPLAKIRSGISDVCCGTAGGFPGIYTLTVPTGGGKTLASLRFAIEHAKQFGMEHIFYVIPFNTILDQNSADIRGALKDTISILEHHGGVVFDENTAEGETENYKRLTARWTSALVLTSMVKFLDAFYGAKRADARRMCHLSNSVIIFDEIQALPKKCTRIFEKAVQFLVDVCGCTVVFCTATQPQLEVKPKPKEIIPDISMLFDALCRTKIIDESASAKTCQDAAREVLALIERHGSVLMIVNTKRMARRLFELVSTEGVPSAYLTTDMYPAHRMERIKEIKTRGSGPFFCVSTALIEAGINISFPCVVRSMASLGSILQAAGRCNRNAELPEGVLGEVHIWELAEESLRGLQEISAAKECTAGLLKSEYASNLNCPKAIDAYYTNEREKFNELLPYPVTTSGVSTSILKLFGKNEAAASGAGSKLRLRGAYRTGQELFKVISSDTRSVLVSHERGAALAAELAAQHNSMSETTRLLREAQRYCVSLFSNVFTELWNEGAIWRIEALAVFVLKEEYYSDQTGLTMQAQIMNDLQY